VALLQRMTMRWSEPHIEAEIVRGGKVPMYVFHNYYGGVISL
jgi:hypothetical protein